MSALPVQGLAPASTRRRLRFDVQINPVKSELDLAADTEVSFVPMDAVGELGGLRLDQTRELSDVCTGYTYFADGDVCIAKITPCFENGKGALAEGLVNGIAFGTTELHVLRPSDRLDARFLFYLTIAHDFRSFGEAEMLGAGGQKRVPEGFLKDWMPLLPSTEEQQRIARFLDHKTARIDALIEKKQALLERLAEMRQALITRAVTKGLNPDVSMKPSGVDWLGEMPNTWSLKRLRFVANLISGSTPSTNVPEYWNGDIPWISPKDMKVDAIFDSEDHLTEFALEESGARLHQSPHALIVVRGMILARTVPVCVAYGRYTINQDMKAIVSLGEVLPEFFRMYLRSIESYLFTLVAEAGHGTKTLRTDVFLDVPVLLPPLEEQRQLVDRLTVQSESFIAAENKTANALLRLSEYRSALITAAVSGQIPELLG